MKKHLATAKDQEMVKHTSGNQSLRTLFAQFPIEESVTRAEVVFANFVAEHNLSFLLADHFTHLTSVMFPDSNIAKPFMSARTKTYGALYPHFNQPIVALCQNNPFSILCNEGNDNDDKYFAILVCLWDDQLGKPVTRVTRFLHMPVCNIRTADKLFDAIDSTLQERNIPWCNVVGFESDTTNVMVGKHNSVLSRIKSEQPGVPRLCMPSVKSVCISWSEGTSCRC